MKFSDVEAALTKVADIQDDTRDENLGLNDLMRTVQDKAMLAGFPDFGGSYPLYTDTMEEKYASVKEAGAASEILEKLKTWWAGLKDKSTIKNLKDKDDKEKKASDLSGSPFETDAETAYWGGFITKCAEADVDPTQVLAFHDELLKQSARAGHPAASLLKAKRPAAEGGEEIAKAVGGGKASDNQLTELIKQILAGQR